MLLDIPKYLSCFDPLPENEQWDDWCRLARADLDTHQHELRMLIKKMNEVDPSFTHLDGTLLLTAMLKGWDAVRSCSFAEFPENTPLATFPLPGEGAWNGEGRFEPWELPAATLIARGANPYQAGPDGLRPWDVAVTEGATALVKQMLRHPLTPRKNGQVDWNCLKVRYLRDTRQYFEQDPILSASRSGRCALVSLLACQGAPVNTPDETGKTPLFKLFTDVDSSVAVEMAKTFLEVGANIAHEDNNGLIALEAWSIHQPISPALRNIWSWTVFQTIEKNPLSGGRFLAAALFANVHSIVKDLSKINLRPSRWDESPGFLPDNATWIEWAARGALARTDVYSRRMGISYKGVSTTCLKSLFTESHNTTSEEVRAWFLLGIKVNIDFRWMDNKDAWPRFQAGVWKNTIQKAHWFIRQTQSSSQSLHWLLNDLRTNNKNGFPAELLPFFIEQTKGSLNEKRRKQEQGHPLYSKIPAQLSGMVVHEHLGLNEASIPHAVEAIRFMLEEECLVKEEFVDNGSKNLFPFQISYDEKEALCKIMEQAQDLGCCFSKVFSDKTFTRIQDYLTEMEKSDNGEKSTHASFLSFIKFLIINDRMEQSLPLAQDRVRVRI